MIEEVRYDVISEWQSPCGGYHVHAQNVSWREAIDVLVNELVSVGCEYTGLSDDADETRRHRVTLARVMRRVARATPRTKQRLYAWADRYTIRKHNAGSIDRNLRHLIQFGM